MKINQLCFGYTNQLLFDNLSFDVPKGKLTAVIGANGSGKSSLLNLLANREQPRSGTIKIANQEIKNLSKRQFSKLVGFLPQQNFFSESITVREFVRYGRLPYHRYQLRLSTIEEEIVTEAIEDCGLQALQNTMMNRLSGGEMQRAFLAMSFAQETEYLLLDEPTTYLDTVHQIKLFESLMKRNQKKGLTILMVLHDFNHALVYSDYLLVMHKGDLVANGLTDQILTEKLLKDYFGVDGELLTSKSGQSFFAATGIGGKHEANYT
ncbi:MAG: ABC transporter ATP-binding protein [Streptococcaceae bacterium]|nr:ABC transporter ATP-binding protein [Streptococcaceae bacterium]MCH4177227.1 ABC transporter ATP-binding protein [Streptococcaceae bacterium]